MIDFPTEELPVQYVHGSALPRYVERLDEVEWVTDRRKPRSVWPLPLAAILVVLGLMLLVLGVASRINAVPPAELFPTGPLPTPTQGSPR